MRKRLLLLLLAFIAIVNANAVERTKLNFNGGWLLKVGDLKSAESSSYNDKGWKQITLPRAFNEKEAFKVSIEHLSDTIMWYRKHFHIQEVGDRKYFIEFEGVRYGADIWLNGKKVGYTENGVMASGFDLTPYIIKGENVIAVRVDNSWNYRERTSGQRFQWNDKNFNANYGGIPKNVFLHITDKLYQTLPLYNNLKTTGIYIYGSNYDIPVIVEVQKWFESCIVKNYANPIADRQIMFSDDESYRKRIVRALNDVDIDVSGYRYDEENHELYTQRMIEGKIYELSFNDESDGTKKMIAALPVILLALQEGRLVIIDELDAKLHPKLLRYVISLFKNKNVNKKGAQLLFTSHDMTTMKNTVFRRDEIWFAAENERHESEIYSLYEIRRENNERVNSTAAYDKQYLEGRYGADPYLTNMLAGGDWQ